MIMMMCMMRMTHLLFTATQDCHLGQGLEVIASVSVMSVSVGFQMKTASEATEI